MSILNLMPHAVGQPRERWRYGQVAAPAPGAFAAPLYVVIPDWDPSRPIRVNGPWPLLYGVALPQVGADCLVATDNRENVRCVWWAGTYVQDPDPD